MREGGGERQFNAAQQGNRPSTLPPLGLLTGISALLSDCPSLGCDRGFCPNFWLKRGLLSSLYHADRIRFCDFGSVGASVLTRMTRHLTIAVAYAVATVVTTTCF